MGAQKRFKREVVLGTVLFCLLAVILGIVILVSSDVGAPLDQEITGAIVTSAGTYGGVDSLDSEITETELINPNNPVSSLDSEITDESSSIVLKFFNLFSSDSGNSLTGAAVGGSDILSGTSDGDGGGVLAQVDCGVSPCNCGDTLTVSRTLNATDNITKCSWVNGLTIGEDHLVLDCNGFPITGTTAKTNVGLTVVSVENVTVQNCAIESFNEGMELGDIDTVTFSMNSISINANYGVFSTGDVNNITFSGNEIHSNVKGMYLVENVATGMNLSENKVFNQSLSGLDIKVINSVIDSNNIYENGAFGIYLNDSNSTNISSNFFTDHNFSGVDIFHSDNILFAENIVTNNTLRLDTVNNSLINLGEYLNTGIILSGDSESNELRDITVTNQVNHSINDLTGLEHSNNIVNRNVTYGSINTSSTNLTVSTKLEPGLIFIFENNNIGITINGSNLNLNVSSQIVIDNLSYSNTPGLFKDGVRCDDTNFCNVSYNQTALFANVSGFSNFTTAEVVHADCTFLNADYEFSESITTVGTCFTINASGITIDGFNQFSLSGNGSGFGINVSDFDNVVIQNLEIDGFSVAVGLESSENTTVSYVNMTNGNGGVELEDSATNTLIEASRFKDMQGAGIMADVVGDNNISVFHSDFINNSNGIQISTPNSTFYNLTFVNHSQKGINVLGGANYTTFEDIILYDNFNDGFFMTGSSLITIKNFTITNDELILESITDSNVSEISIRNGSFVFQVNSNSNLFTNITVNENDDFFQIDDRTDLTETSSLKFENFYGSILFFNSTNLSTDTNLLFGDSHYLEQNNIGFEMNTSLSTLNATRVIQITIENLSYPETPQLLKDGTRCDNDLSLCNISYDVSSGILSANVTGFSNYSTSSSSTDCTTINADFDVTQNNNATGTCFTINASNIELNGKGYSIQGDSSGHGISVGNNSNVTIINFANILNFSSGIQLGSAGANNLVNNVTINTTQGEYGIFIGSDGTVVNNSIIDCNCSGGLNANVAFLAGSSGATLESNTIIASGNNDAIQVGSSSSHRFYRNDVFAYEGTAVNVSTVGASNIFLDNNLSSAQNTVVSGSDGNFTTNNITSLSVLYPAVLIIGDENIFDSNDIVSGFYAVHFGSENYEPHHTEFINNTLISTANTIVYLENGSNSTFVNDTFVKNSPGENEVAGLQGDHIFRNVTFDKNNVSFDPGSNASILLQWYVDVNVSNSTGIAVNAATVNIYNISNLSVLSATTGSDGFVLGQIVSEGTISSTGWDYATPHFVEGIKSGYDIAVNSTINLTSLSHANATVIINVSDADLSCGTLTSSVTLTEDINAAGDCFDIETNSLVIDLAGYSINGDDTGNAFSIGNISSLVIKNGFVDDFENSFVIRHASSVNITNVSIISAEEYGFLLEDVNSSTIEGNVAENLVTGLNLSWGFDNSIYNNKFNATRNNILAAGNNTYNISYGCSDDYLNILSGNCTGGNYWQNYTGLDDGSGSSYPNNVSYDGVGDTLLPYTVSITDSEPVEDYFPLLSCSPSWSCGAWQACTGSTQARSCVDSNACGVDNGKPIEVKDCESSGSGSSGSSGNSGESESSEESNSESENSETEGSDADSNIADSGNTDSDGSVAYAPTQEGQVVGPINAELPPADEILAPELVKENLIVNLIDSEPVDAPVIGTIIGPDGEISEVSGETDDTGSESSNLAGDAGSTSSGSSTGDSSGSESGSEADFGSSDISQKTAAVVDSSYDARRVAELPREKITLSIQNTDLEKSMVLKPIATQEVEDVKPVITRKVYDGATSGGSALKVSSSAVSSDMVSASLGAIERIVIAPGSTENVQVEVTGGYATTSNTFVTVAFFAGEDGDLSDEAVYTQELEIKREVVTTSSVVPSEDGNSIDVFAVIIEREKTDSSLIQSVTDSVSANGLTGAIAGIPGELIDSFDPYSGFTVYDGQYLEISLRDVSEGSFGNLGGKFSFLGSLLTGSDSRILFTDVYGPYDISTQLEGVDSDQEGFVFAQKFGYNPDQLSSGKYVVDMVISDDRGKLSSQSFLLDLDSENDLQDTIESEIAASELESESTDLENYEEGGNSLTGALVSDMTAAISFSQIVSVAYEQTEEAAYIIYQDTLPNREAKIAFLFLLLIVGGCLIIFVFGPVRPVLFDTLGGMKDHLGELRKDLNA